MTWNEIDVYYARWDYVNHRGKLGVKDVDGSWHWITTSVPAEYRAMIDILRNEKPVYWDEREWLRTSYEEEPGEEEDPRALDRAITIASGGQARATIIIADDPSIAEHTAAAELAHYLEEATGATFSVETESGITASGLRVWVGPNEFSDPKRPRFWDYGPGGMGHSHHGQ